jgi:uncharacterized protein YraI
MKRNFHLLVIPVLVLAVLACNLPALQQDVQVTPSLQQDATATASSLEPSLVPTDVPATATEEIAPTFEPTSTSAVVTITANGGNINIRRGPGVGYNPIAVFTKGQSTVATARNEDGSWLKITAQDGSGKPGWVNAKTQYSSISGDVTLLPVETVEAPAPAYIRNCTFHVMQIQLADIKIENQTKTPDNKVKFNPGNYEVFDTTVSGSKAVQVINLREGDTIDITHDGVGNTYSCP